MRATLVCLFLLVTPVFLNAATPPAPASEFAQPQSPAKPVPFPINYVDQGQFDSKL